jgi:hypothetical protein
MNAITDSLIKYFDGFNNVKTVVIDADKLVSKEQTWQIIEDIYYQDYSKLANYTSYSTLRYNFECAIELIGLEWSNKKGKFTKRLLKEMPNLTPFAGILGDAITRKAYNPKGKTWMLSITEEIFWQDGNFGKEGSCWWFGYRESKDVFLDAGGLGLLWHKNEDPYNGIGRAWLLPIDEYIRGHGNHDILAIFNQYGKDQTETPIRIEETAKVINRIVDNTDYIDACLYNDNDDDIPYINGNHCLMVKEQSIDIQDHEIHLELGDCSATYCEECNERLTEDEVYWNENGNAYCESCYNDNYSHCEECGNEVYNNDAYTDYNGYAICYRCYSRYYFTCEDCSEIHKSEDAIEIDGYDYCEDCAPSHQPEEEEETEE